MREGEIGPKFQYPAMGISCEAFSRCWIKRDLAPGGFSFLFDPMDAWNDILRAEMRLNPRESGTLTCRWVPWSR